MRTAARTPAASRALMGKVRGSSSGKEITRADESSLGACLCALRAPRSLVSAGSTAELLEASFACCA